MKVSYIVLSIAAIIIVVLFSLYLYDNEISPPEQTEHIVEEVIEPEDVMPEEGAEIPVIEEPGVEVIDRVEIEIKNWKFIPADIIIKPGTTVTWVNNDNVPHKVAAYSRLFYGPRLSPGEKYSFTFTNVGIHGYFDAVFPKAGKGKIIVREEPLPITGNVIAADFEETNSKFALLVLLFIIMTIGLSHGMYTHHKT